MPFLLLSSSQLTLATGGVITVQRRIGFRALYLVTANDTDPSSSSGKDGSADFTMRIKVGRLSASECGAGRNREACSYSCCHHWQLIDAMSGCEFAPAPNCPFFLCCTSLHDFFRLPGAVQVNGADVFSRGANVIPMEELEGRQSAEAYTQVCVCVRARSSYTLQHGF